mmetsp:Transcript_48806/g.72865  ORF Transcript_48806/g.72865 Transcript_48806/m.72865 type:complete len:94 (+) Transcript_48806:44-325(+)
MNGDIPSRAISVATGGSTPPNKKRRADNVSLGHARSSDGALSPSLNKLMRIASKHLINKVQPAEIVFVVVFIGNIASRGFMWIQTRGRIDCKA